jgi:hypothetical protein
MFAINPSSRELPLRPLKDLTPVTLVAFTP